MKNIKKSQEEMIGFVMIIILVSVISVILLGIAIRRDPQIREDARINSFLYSMMGVTSDCQTSPEFVLDYRSLLEKCYEGGGTCLDDREICDVLDEVSQELLEVYFRGRREELEGYAYEIYLEDEEIYSFDKGNLSGSIRGGAASIPYRGGNIYLELEVYS